MHAAKVGIAMNSETREEQDQAKRNYDIYLAEHKLEAERAHRGKTALMHDGEVIDYYNDEDDAVTAGRQFYGLGHFSIVRVGAKPIRLGAMTPLV